MQVLRITWLLTAVALLANHVQAAGRRLEVPYYWQSGSSWCWAASASMMANYYRTSEPDGLLKPWYGGKLLKIGKNEGVKGGDADIHLDLLRTLNPQVIWTYSTYTSWFSFSSAKSKIIERIDRGHPVEVVIHRARHAVVVTGYDGENDSDHVFVNDPSGAVFLSNGQLCNQAITWAEFIFKIDELIKQDDIEGSGYLFYNASLADSTNAKKVSVDFCPPLGNPPGLGTKSGVLAIPAGNGQPTVALEWDGKTYPGYYLKGKNDSVLPYGAAVLANQTLEFRPTIFNSSSSILNAQVSLAILDKNNRSIVASQNKTISIPANFNAPEIVFSFPVTSFHTNGLSISAYTVQATVSAGGSRDIVSMDFQVKVSSIDLMFLIDTTGSMADDIASVKQQAISLVDSIFNEFSDVRIGVIDYRDFPARSHSEFDYAARTVISFTGNKSEIVSGINSLTIGDGGDIPETIFSAFKHALDGNAGKWRRNPVQKSIILVGDAYPLDPEPFTGLTSGITLGRLSAGDFALESTGGNVGLSSSTPNEAISVYSLAIGFDNFAQDYFRYLSANSGGSFFKSYGSEIVVNTLGALVSTIASPKFGVGTKPGSTDANGYLKLNSQTLLYEHEIAITNSSGYDIGGFRFYYTDFPGDLVPMNASGFDIASDRCYVLYEKPLASGESVNLKLEYFCQPRQIHKSTIGFTVELSSERTVKVDGAGFMFGKAPVFTNPYVALLNFQSQPGKHYRVEYSNDLVVWRTTSLAVTAISETIAWFDNGQPKTESYPGTVQKRFYRVVELP